MNPASSESSIIIKGLRLLCHIGVPEEERAGEQELSLDVTLALTCDFASMGDSIAATVDYAALAEDLQKVAASHPRCLIETLASDLACFILARYPLVAMVSLELRKFILPSTEYVAVCYRLRR